MAASPAEAEMEKKLMRLKKDELKVEARKLSLDESGTKSDLVISRNFTLIFEKVIFCQIFDLATLCLHLKLFVLKTSKTTFEQLCNHQTKYSHK